MFKLWKLDGKPTSNNTPSKCNFANARANLQRIIRKQRNFFHIRQHNHLKFLDKKNRSKIFSAVRRFRCDPLNTTTPVLHTPVGNFHGGDVLEGFASDAEHLGKSNEAITYFAQGFYKLCKLDNPCIFDFLSEHDAKIPPMTISQLNDILQYRMKAGKACDVHQLTVEHIRNCGDDAKLTIVKLINRIIENIYYLSCPQIKLGLGTAVFKGKRKPVAKSSSYRRITVTPVLGAIIDYYLDPQSEAVFRPKQSPDQLGFTSRISYLLATIQRGNVKGGPLTRKLPALGSHWTGNLPSLLLNERSR